MAREDFEIYRVIKDGEIYYKFKVDFYGAYYAKTKQAILKKREKIQEEVKEKLEWVEQENQKYYARLAEQERQRALYLKKIKKKEKKLPV